MSHMPRPRTTSSATTAAGRPARRGMLGRFLGSGAPSAGSLDALRGWNDHGARLVFAASLFAALTVAVALAVSSALAVTPTTFAEDGSAAGQVNNPQGMDVHQSTGALFIADLNNRRVDRFDSQGSFELAWGWGVIDGSDELQVCGPEADPPTAACVQGTSGSDPGKQQPGDVAADQSSGDVYASDSGSWRVQKFSPDGEFLLMLGREVNKDTGADVCTAADVQAGDECGNGVRGTGTGQINQFLPSLAVDASGRLWLGDTGRLIEFDSDGALVAEIDLPGSSAVIDLEVDSSGDFYARRAGEDGIRKYDPSGTEIDVVNEVDAIDMVISLDGADNLYIAERPAFQVDAVFKVFDPAGQQIKQFGKGQILGNRGPVGIAVGDDAENLYSSGGSGGVAQLFPLPEPGPLGQNERATDVLPTTATLSADLNAQGEETTHHFEWGTSDSYGETTPVETLPASFDDVPIEADLDGLEPETTYHFQLVAVNDDGTYTSSDRTFTTLPTVAINAQWASDVTATSASFNALLDPLGPEAEWWIEYGPAGSFGSTTPVEFLPAGFGEVAVRAHVQDLEPATTYHYRFVGRSERDGTVHTARGEEHTLLTQVTAPGFALPDGRAWELVSPAAKGAGTIVLAEPGGIGIRRAAPDGSALTYVSIAPVDTDPEGSRAINMSQNLARHGAGGWSSRDITLPNTEAFGDVAGYGNEYKQVSADLSRALVRPLDGTLHSERASGWTPYLRDNFADPAAYAPLVTEKEPWSNVDEGADLSDFRPGAGNDVWAATPDLSHAVFDSQAALLEGAPSGAANSGLYRWAAADGGLDLVSVLPDGTARSGAIGGGSSASSPNQGVRTNVISADGSRIVWNAAGRDLYLRDVEAGETVHLDEVQPGASGLGSESPLFQGASADGGRVFFRDTQRLTADAGGSGGSADLYMCEIVTGPSAPPNGSLGCELTDLTPNGFQAAGVQGVPGLAADGRTLYVVARAALAGEATAGEDNLYLLREDPGSGEWETRFIATLDPGDRVAHETAGVSPSGRYLAFMSKRSLTGYDNRDARTGERVQEVFRYDAAADELACVSCDPHGGRPAGDENISSLVDPRGDFQDRRLGAMLPTSNRRNLTRLSSQQPRFVLDNGRVFFNAFDDLVAADTNGAWDVYQYEPLGTGDCTAGSGGASVARTAGGCVALLTSGAHPGDSGFVDASESGDDVFVLTAARLSHQDLDGRYDIYNAQVCRPERPCTPPAAEPPAECDSPASCRDAAGDPAEGADTPGSAAFEGAGNVAPATDPRRCNRLRDRAQRQGQKAKRLRQRARKLRQRSNRQAARGSAQRAKQLRKRGRRVQRRAKSTRQRAKSLRQRARSCRREARR